ncbi:MAG: glucose 1-dehydrogenase [Rhizobiales bacterium]|nr:glucose 1-dehydrogenase [Hyphomicrobiales bacterium]
MNRLDGKTVLITGGARGIGRCCAEMMMREGAEVAISDIDIASARQTADDIGVALALQHDVTRLDDWHAAINATRDAFGSLNVLVNNAGIVIPGSVESLDEADWDRTMDVDLKSVFLGCKAALPLMATGTPGSIVNISSIAALVAGHNFAAYNAAKAGVLLLTKSVALHAARKGYGVRCNSVHPAFIDTGMVDEVVRADTPQQAREKLAKQVPLGTIGTVEDVGWAVVYLASDESRFMTGSELKLDGGLSAM